MINKEKLENLGLKFVDEYSYDDAHHSFVLEKDNICVIVDDNICETDKETIFDYSKYCEMQNKYMAEFQKLYRFNYVDDNCYDKIKEWLCKTVEDIEVKDDGGSFDVAHADNTPLEKTFEDLFVDTYGDNATEYLKKEYPISLANGRNAFVDYVIETKNGNFAIEENGVHYHHPCIIGNKAYDRQLEKQNTLNLYGFKVFRFSIQNLTFKEQAIDNIKTYLGDKETFINSVIVKQERKFKLYEHQEQILDDLHKSRQEGINTALIVIPTGTGKSQIVIEDIKDLAKKDEIHNVLIMVPTTTLKNDWKKSVENLDKSLNIEIKFYNTVFQEKNSLDKSYYDYIVFDEAHHANYADLEKTLIVDSRNELIVKTIKKYFSSKKDFYKQGIVFCVNINHCKKLEKLLNNQGVTAKAVYGSNKSNDEIFEKYKNKGIQFLLSCQIISEGWDCPQTEIVVMARPTLSKVLYLQQIGRGVRNYPGKECLYVIDVVDNYAGKLTPWSFNSLFKIANYSDFAGVINNKFDYLNILGLSENEISMQAIDVFTFEEKYKDYKSLEQTARDLFIGTNTLSKWVKQNPNFSSLYLPIGSKMMPYFSNADIQNIKQIKKLKDRNEETILQDFIDFVDENTLTYSFKLIFLLNMFKLADKEGEVNMDNLIDEYSAFYKDRIERNLQVDRSGCVYDMEYLNDRTKMKKSILDNPFEKFERKRFVYFSKDLNILSFNPNLWSKFTDEIKDEIISKEKKFLEDYYKNMGGL